MGHEGSVVIPRTTGNPLGVLHEKIFLKPLICKPLSIIRLNSQLCFERIELKSGVYFVNKI